MIYQIVPIVRATINNYLSFNPITRSANCLVLVYHYGQELFLILFTDIQLAGIFYKTFSMVMLIYQT